MIFLRAYVFLFFSLLVFARNLNLQTKNSTESLTNSSEGLEMQTSIPNFILSSDITTVQPEDITSGHNLQDVQNVSVIDNIRDK